MKYNKIYSGGIPSFQDNDIFKVIIPLIQVDARKEDCFKKSYLKNSVENINIKENIILNVQNKDIESIENGTENGNDDQNGIDNGTDNGTDNDNDDEKEQKILNEINKNAHITQKELSQVLKISKRSIVRNIQILKQNKKIKRIGSDRTGYWKIL